MGYLEDFLAGSSGSAIIRSADVTAPRNFGAQSSSYLPYANTPAVSPGDYASRGYSAGVEADRSIGTASAVRPKEVGLPNTVLQDEIARDQRMGDRALRQAGMDSTTINADLMNSLQQQMEWYQAQRDRAIRAAGRGAGAPYNAAIARIGRELERTQGQLGRMGPFFDDKRAKQGLIWDNAQTELGTSYDEALGELDLLNRQAYDVLSATFSSAQSRTTDVLNKIGADENTRIAAAEQVGALEDEIMEMDQINGENRARIMQASEDLAVALAGSAGADNKLELVRNQIMVESDMKEQIHKLMEDRKQQIAARNAAVSAAREMAAARMPESLPMNAAGFGSNATRQIFDKMMANAPDAARSDVESLMAQFSSLGMSKSDTTQILRGAQAIASGRDVAPQVEQLASRYSLDLESIAVLPSSSLTWAHRTLPTALDTYSAGVNYFNDNIAGTMPSDHPNGSAAQAMSVYEQLVNMGMTESDAVHQTREYVADAERGQDVSQLERFFNKGGM